MSSLIFPRLPLEPNTTRMIRLLPDEDKDAQIECEFLNYNLSEKSGGKGLYEALSYAWGNDQEGSAGKCQ